MRRIRNKKAGLKPGPRYKDPEPPSTPITPGVAQPVILDLPDTAASRRNEEIREGSYNGSPRFFTPSGSTRQENYVSYEYSFQVDRDLLDRCTVMSVTVLASDHSRRHIESYTATIRLIDDITRHTGIDTFYQTGIELGRRLNGVVYLPMFYRHYCDALITMGRTWSDLATPDRLATASLLERLLADFADGWGGNR